MWGGGWTVAPLGAFRGEFWPPSMPIPMSRPSRRSTRESSIGHSFLKKAANPDTNHQQAQALVLTERPEFKALFQAATAAVRQ